MINVSNSLKEIYPSTALSLDQRQIRIPLDTTIDQTFFHSTTHSHNSSSPLLHHFATPQTLFSLDCFRNSNNKRTTRQPHHTSCMSLVPSSLDSTSCARNAAKKSIATQATSTKMIVQEAFAPTYSRNREKKPTTTRLTTGSTFLKTCIMDPM